MTILVLLAILISLLLGLLFLPIIIFIDTTSNQYYLQLKGVFKINHIYRDGLQDLFKNIPIKADDIEALMKKKK